MKKTHEISGLPTDSGADTTLLSVRSAQLNTRSMVDTNVLISESPKFKYDAEGPLF
jgi:hypothetical protein